MGDVLFFLFLMLAVFVFGAAGGIASVGDPRPVCEALAHVTADTLAVAQEHPVCYDHLTKLYLDARLTPEGTQGVQP